MANNTFYGYSPKKEKLPKHDKAWSGAEKSKRKGQVTQGTYNNIGTRLDRINPYEYRKGMDYELTGMGVARLRESTSEERQKATETVLKNLETKHPSYYSALIQFEAGMNHAGKINETSFNSFLKNYSMGHGDGMVSVDTKIKDDKMVELKESIKKEIKSVLLEKKVKEQDMTGLPQDMDMDDDKADKAATKRAKKVKGDRFGEEREAIEALLFKGDGKNDEYNEKNPAPGTFKAMAKEALETYSTKYKGQADGLEQYNAYLADINEKKLLPKIEKLVEKLQKKFDKENNQTTITLDKVYAKKVDTKGYKGDGRLPDTIKLLQKRLEEIKKEEEKELVKHETMRRSVAETDMTREQHIKLLEIIREQGISLREGTQNIKPYYEIAKAAYLEGLANGLKI